MEAGLSTPTRLRMPPPPTEDVDVLAEELVEVLKGVDDVLVVFTSALVASAGTVVVPICMWSHQSASSAVEGLHAQSW